MGEQADLFKHRGLEQLWLFMLYLQQVRVALRPVYPQGTRAGSIQGMKLLNLRTPRKRNDSLDPNPILPDAPLPQDQGAEKFLIHPDLARNAKIEWPDVDLDK